VHKDIKPENILVESDAFGQILIKIGDLGSCSYLEEDD
jgi:serine/threonine protein kinase